MSLLQRFALAGLFGLITSTATAQSIQGTAAFRERMALPSAAFLEATLEDVSHADAPAEVIARARVESPGNPPIAFAITYDPAKILPDRRYVVRARILLGDKLLFATDTATSVLTRGGSNTVSLMLRRVGSKSPEPGSLARTSWQLVKFQGGDGQTLTPDDGAKYTIESPMATVDSPHRLQPRRAPGNLAGRSASVRCDGADARAVPGRTLHDHIVKQWLTSVLCHKDATSSCR